MHPCSGFQGEKIVRLVIMAPRESGLIGVPKSCNRMARIIGPERLLFGRGARRGFQDTRGFEAAVLLARAKELACMTFTSYFVITATAARAVESRHGPESVFDMLPAARRCASPRHRANRHATLSSLRSFWPSKWGWRISRSAIHQIASEKWTRPVRRWRDQKRAPWSPSWATTGGCGVVKTDYRRRNWRN